MAQTGAARAQRGAGPRLERADQPRVLRPARGSAGPHAAGSPPADRQRLRLVLLRRRADTLPLVRLARPDRRRRDRRRRSCVDQAARRRQRDRAALSPRHPAARLAPRQGHRGPLGHPRLPSALWSRSRGDVAPRDCGRQRDARGAGAGGHSLHGTRAASGHRTAAAWPAGAVAERLARAGDLLLRRRTGARHRLQRRPPRHDRMARPHRGDADGRRRADHHLRCHRRRDLRAPPSRGRPRTRGADRPGRPRPRHAPHQLRRAARGASTGAGCRAGGAHRLELPALAGAVAGRLRLPDGWCDVAGVAHAAPRRPAATRGDDPCDRRRRVARRSRRSVDDA